MTLAAGRAGSDLRGDLFIDITAATRVQCLSCGLEQRVSDIPPHYLAECRRCGAELSHGFDHRFGVSLALALTALLLLSFANLNPLMAVAAQGVTRENLLAGGPTALWSEGFPSLGLVVAAFSVAAPLAYLLLVSTALALIELDLRPSGLGALFRWAQRLRPWAMAEVYLAGSFVAYTRLEVIAKVRIDLGGWAFLAAVFALLAADVSIDATAIWRAIAAPVKVEPGRRSWACIDCGQLTADARIGDRCTRCAAPLHRRKVDAIGRTAALVITAFLLYIPANLMPILSIERLGRIRQSTIVGGVGELVDAGLWPLGLLVFIASIAVPVLKLLGLSWFLIAIRLRSGRALVVRTRLFHLIDVIGRWSNIDVFMISILAALVQFGELTQVHAEPGAVAFAAVVIITMIASRSFDPRLMWDAAEQRSDGSSAEGVTEP